MPRNIKSATPAPSVSGGSNPGSKRKGQSEGQRVKPKAEPVEPKDDKKPRRKKRDAGSKKSDRKSRKDKKC